MGARPGSGRRGPVAERTRSVARPARSSLVAAPLVAASLVAASLVGASFVAASLVAADARAAPPPAAVSEDEVDGGVHWRIEHRGRVVHAWQPPGYEPRRAGVVVYLHGHSTSADGTWSADSLPRQFRASLQNALFLVPDAPPNARVAPPFASPDALLAFVRRHARLALPRGTMVLAGHSGAYRTIAAWLPSPRVETVILLDAMYGFEAEFAAWVTVEPGVARPHRLVLISSTTAPRSEAFLATLGDDVARRSELPPTFDEFTRTERRARVVYVRTAAGHMEVVTAGRALPLLLRLSPLRRVDLPATGAAPGPPAPATL